MYIRLEAHLLYLQDAEYLRVHLKRTDAHGNNDIQVKNIVGKPKGEKVVLFTGISDPSEKLVFEAFTHNSQNLQCCRMICTEQTVARYHHLQHPIIFRMYHEVDETANLVQAGSADQAGPSTSRD